MTGLTCKYCGGDIHEEMDSSCWCDTCGYVMNPDGSVIIEKDDDDEIDKN